MGGMGTAGELEAVRKRLDSLTAQRLCGPLGPHAGQIYEALCAIEKKLLAALEGTGKADGQTGPGHLPARAK